MICIAVFENDRIKREQLREMITLYTIRNDMDIDVLWIYGGLGEDKIQKYANRIQIAFISLDSDNGQAAADILYSYNRDSLMVLYSEQPRRIEPLLGSRPKAFHLWEYGRKPLYDKLDELIRELIRSDSVFVYQTKRMMYIYPVRQIRYFQSDLKHIEIHTHEGRENERIYAKLSEIEKDLGRCFLRIHKSYIINTLFIDRLDKKEHMLFLTDGEALPVSDAQYKKVIGFLEDKEVKL